MGVGERDEFWVKGVRGVRGMRGVRGVCEGCVIGSKEEDASSKGWLREDYECRV